MDSGTQRVKTIFKDAHLSATRSRLLVFTKLADAGPSSVGSLVEGLNKNVDRATIYRTIDLFERLGIVNRIWHGSEHQVELSEIFTPHHHHALCQQCGRTVDIASPELEAALTSLAKKHRFLALTHSVEVTGYCPDCQ